MSDTVPLTGLEEMKRQLQALPAEMRKSVVNPALLLAAKSLQQAVKDRAPVKTGALRDNIIVYRDRHPERDGATAKYSVLVRKIKLNRSVRRLLRRVRGAGAAVKISDDAFYWRFPEFGTSKMVARPFFRPAIEQTKGTFIATVGEGLQKGMDKAVKKLGAK